MRLDDAEIAAIKKQARKLWDEANRKRSLEIRAEAIRRLQDVGRYDQALNLTIGVGHGYDWIGNYDKAASVYQTALKLAKKTGNTKQQSYALHNLGGIYLKRGNTSEALTHFKRSLAIRKEIGLPPNVISESLHNIGRAYVYRREFDKAFQHYDQALQIRKKLIEEPHSIKDLKEGWYHRNLAQSIFHLIMLYQKMGRDDRSEELIDLLDTYTPDGNISTTYQFSLYSKFSRALVLKTEDRLEKKFQAAEILRQISGDPRTKQQYRVLAIKHLIELLVIEYKATGLTKVKEEISEQIQRLMGFASKQGSYLLRVQGLVLQAKLAVQDGDVEKAREKLHHGEEVAREMQLKSMVDDIRQEKEMIDNEIYRWRRLTKENSELIEKIEERDLQTYIQSMQQENELVD